MAKNKKNGSDLSNPTINNSTTLVTLAIQLSTLTHQLVGIPELTSETEEVMEQSTVLLIDRPSIVHRNTPLSTEYLSDLAVRVEKMCTQIFHLNGSNTLNTRLN